MKLNPNQFRPTGGVWEDYANDTTSAWPLSHGRTGGNVAQVLTVEQGANGRWGGVVSSARYDSDRSGAVENLQDTDDQVRHDTVRSPQGRDSFRTLARAAVVGRRMMPTYARVHAEDEPAPY